MKALPLALLALVLLPAFSSCNRDMENMQPVYIESQANEAQKAEHWNMRRALFKERNFSLKPVANVYYDGEFYYVVDGFIREPRSAWEIRRRGRTITPQKYAEYCGRKAEGQ